MKQTIIAAFLFLSFSIAKSQVVYNPVSINFCAWVEADGHCDYSSNKFFFSPDSSNMRIFVQVKDDRTFAGTSKIVLKFFTVDKAGKETFANAQEMPVQDGWMFTWVPYLFYKTGKYSVKAYDDKDNLLVSRPLEFLENK